MSDNRNLLLAIVLSVAVLAVWEYFFAGPQQKAQHAPLTTEQTAPGNGPAATTSQAAGAAAPAVPGTAAAAQAAHATRTAAIAATPRVRIDTPLLKGSIDLRGARIDDVALKDYRVTVDPKSPNVTLLSPSGAPHPYYAAFGWAVSPGSNTAVPDADTVWTADGKGPLTPSSPLHLTWNNGHGLVFHRTIAVDRDYMFTVTQQVDNTTGQPVTLSPYALVSRHGKQVAASTIYLHVGPIGWFGDNGLEELSYSSLDSDKTKSFTTTKGWLGFTDKYWAATVVPPQTEKPYTVRFLSTGGDNPIYQADYLLNPVTIAPGGHGSTSSRLFAGAKDVNIVNHYANQENVPRFDLVIDWGWFYFITKPLFWLIDYIFRLVGNFGIAILITTVVIKTIFFPLANKAYASMSKMKRLQPEMTRMRERFKDDRAAQQKALMELYKKEKINPVAGCLPMLIQIPVFFALYTVLYNTIEMRHAPFFGWIRDLSAPDPTTIFNLFGLIPWDPSTVPFLGHYLATLGVWPLIMGCTMWVQMRLNPVPPDPTQAMIFNWMPVFFTFFLGSFPAGLVIYYSWNNTLTIIQQSIIMRRQGVKVDLLGNIRSSFARKRPRPQS
jgi:YidC/Oxa1 family membrane protein insertase